MNVVAPTPLYARQIRVVNMALNGHEERRALPDGPPVLVKGRALIGPTEFPVQRWKPEIFRGESVHRTRGGKWLIDYKNPGLAGTRPEREPLAPDTDGAAGGAGIPNTPEKG